MSRNSQRKSVIRKGWKKKELEEVSKGGSMKKRKIEGRENWKHQGGKENGK